jgi:hypothetical protein
MMLLYSKRVSRVEKQGSSFELVQAAFQGVSGTAVK